MTPHPPAPPLTGGGAARPHRGPGLLLIIPAALMALVSLVVPTGQTIVRSFQMGGGILGRAPRSAGLHNYGELLAHSAFWKALAFSLSLAVLPILVILLIGPLLAAALDRAGTWPRRVGRVLLSLPLVVFSPVAVVGAWRTGQLDGGVATAFGKLQDIGPWSPTVPLITAAAMFGFLCGLALLVFLPVLRGRAQGRPLTPTMMAIGAITVLAAVAVALQAFSIDLTLTFGRQATLSTLQYRASYQFFDIGSGAAVSTLTGLILGVLGVLATFIAVRTGLRVELAPRETDGPKADPRPGAGGRAAIGILALVAVVAIAVLCSWPWLSALFSTGHTPPLRPSAARVYANTWIPPLLGAIVSVGTAYLAALGIGGLRPLGRNSEWLLLPFAPWLFVGVMPLSVAGFDNARRLHLLNHFIVLIPPILLSVPSLLVLTLFCRTRSARWRAQGNGGTQSFVRLVALPALPLTVLMGGVTMLFGVHGLLWPLVVGTGNSAVTAPVALLRQLSQFGATQDLPYGVTTPLVMVVLTFLILATLQVLYLDRLVITTGPTGEPGDTNHPGAMPIPAQQPQWPVPEGYGPGGSGPGGYGPPPAHPIQPGTYAPPPGAYVPPPDAYGPPPIQPAQPGDYGPPPGQPGRYGPPPGQPGGNGPPAGQPGQTGGHDTRSEPLAQPSGYGTPSEQPGQYGQPDGHGAGAGRPGGYGPPIEQPTITDRPHSPPAAAHIPDDDPNPGATVSDTSDTGAPDSSAPAPGVPGSGAPGSGDD
ncbi:MAG: hypothetical protein ACRDP6_45785 [Actinoallomurus sp.]